MSMAVETFGFFMAAVGLLMLGVTLPNSYWRVSTVHGNVITTNTIFENLWFSCATDSLGVYNCWEFPSMLALSGSTDSPASLSGGTGLLVRLMSIKGPCEGRRLASCRLSVRCKEAVCVQGIFRPAGHS
ncbi:CLDN15 isoform 2 [Pan troglodytes]|uniref:Claudin n=2 Tax=Pan troglodytes TaxID=9598 RepID=A0A2I3SJA1_PANTR|nr:CLDN15 isoform 2 [Pan troglodytes]